MVIGVIGASIAGLAAARSLGQKGHQVIVFEKGSTWSGRFTTMKVGADHTPVDIHIPYISAHGDAFKAILNELSSKELMKQMDTSVQSFVNGETSDNSMMFEGAELYASTKGMDKVANYMARYADVKFDSEVVGVTYIGANTKKKAPWMINLVSNEVFELDAVIVALPSPQACAILENAQDETPVRKSIAQINEIRYTARYSVVATYPNKSVSDLSVMEIGGNDVELIVNESEKNGSKDLILTLHSSNDFFLKAVDLTKTEIIDHLLKEASKIIGDYAYNPEYSFVEKRKYVKPESHVDLSFINVPGLDGKLGIVGDFFNGSSIESAYNSGMSLAAEWNK